MNESNKCAGRGSCPSAPEWQVVWTVTDDDGNDQISYFCQSCADNLSYHDSFHVATNSCSVAQWIKLANGTDEGGVYSVPVSRRRQTDPSLSPAWKSYRVAGGWVVSPEVCEEQEDGSYVTQWGVDAPFGRGTCSLCFALSEGQYVHDASNEDRNIPKRALDAIVKLADKLSEAGVY